jgi:hypothetical protein
VRVSRGRKVERQACSVIGTRQFREMEVREQRSKGTLLKTTKGSKGKEKEKEKDQGLPSRSSQMAEEGWSCVSEQRRAIMAVTQMLNSGTLDEESSQLLEQLANRIHHQQTTVVPGSGSSPRPKQQPAPPRGVQAEAEPSEERATEESEPESSHGNSSDGSTEAEVVVGPLLTVQKDRVRLVEHRELCQGCLTSEHSEAAESCQCKEPGQSQVPTEAPPVPTEVPPVPPQALPVPTQAPPVPTQAPPVPTQAPPVLPQAPPVPTEGPPVPPKAPPVSTEADLVPAEADQGSAEEQLTAAVAELVPAEMRLEAADAPLVPTTTRPADTARKRTPLAVTEDSGPVLLSEQEAGATALHAEAVRPVEGAEALTSPQSHAGMPVGTGEEPGEPRDAAPSPPPERRGAAGWSSWEDQLSRRNQDIFDYKEFRELSPEARLKLVRKHGLCKLCLGRCDPGGKRLHKECRWRNQIWHELCQEQNKCRRSHHRLLHVEDVRSLQAARPAKPAKPPDRLRKSSACSRTEASRGAPAAGRRCFRHPGCRQVRRQSQQMRRGERP